MNYIYKMDGKGVISLAMKLLRREYKYRAKLNSIPKGGNTHRVFFSQIPLEKTLKFLIPILLHTVNYTQSGRLSLELQNS